MNADATPTGRRRLPSAEPSSHGARVFYGVPNMPDGAPAGGALKLVRMQQYFPSHPDDYNILYLVSSFVPTGWQSLFWQARKRGARIVWNQDGAGRPEWHGPDLPKHKGLECADYVFYQSWFCQRAADRFLGAREGDFEVLHNAVDTECLVPRRGVNRGRELVLLLAGTNYLSYRLDVAIRTLALLRRDGLDVSLLVTDASSSDSGSRSGLELANNLAERHGVRRHVRFVGRYSPSQVVDVFSQADILLHPTYNDPCPNVVLEAMSCGLPIVYSASGGTSELVGSEAGRGVPAEERWDTDLIPDPRAMADEVQTVWGSFPKYSQAARQRACALFDIQPWIRRHREIFAEVLKRPPRRQTRTSTCLRLEAVDPQQSEAGTSFNRQPDGQNGLTIVCRGATPSTFVVIADRALTTIFGSASWLTASVPPSLLLEAGERAVQLVDGLDESNTLRLQVLESRSPTPLKLRSIAPAAIELGKPLNVQGVGVSALSVDCEGARPDTIVVFANLSLVTTYGGTNWLTALVPEALVSRPGRYSVQLHDDGRRSNTLYLTVWNPQSSTGEEGM